MPNENHSSWNDLEIEQRISPISTRTNQAKNEGGNVMCRPRFFTELSGDLLNDANADLVLGVGYDTFQSRTAFNEYKKLTVNNNNVQFYLAGHSLGGRIAQDVLYKTYNSNEGFLGLGKSNITTPVHSATFNALGYNRIVYTTLENDILDQYKNKLNNYCYEHDLVGGLFGDSVGYIRAGTNITPPWTAKDKNGNYIVDSNKIWYYVTEVHGIELWYYDENLAYPHIGIVD